MPWRTLDTPTTGPQGVFNPARLPPIRTPDNRAYKLGQWEKHNRPLHPSVKHCSRWLYCTAGGYTGILSAPHCTPFARRAVGGR